MSLNIFNLKVPSLQSPRIESPLPDFIPGTMDSQEIPYMAIPASQQTSGNTPFRDWSSTLYEYDPVIGKIVIKRDTRGDGQTNRQINRFDGLTEATQQMQSAFADQGNGNVRRPRREGRRHVSSDLGMQNTWQTDAIRVPAQGMSPAQVRPLERPMVVRDSRDLEGADPEYADRVQPVLRQQTAKRADEIRKGLNLDVRGYPSSLVGETFYAAQKPFTFFPFDTDEHLVQTQNDYLDALRLEREWNSNRDQLRQGYDIDQLMNQYYNAQAYMSALGSGVPYNKTPYDIRRNPYGALSDINYAGTNTSTAALGAIGAGALLSMTPMAGDALPWLGEQFGASATTLGNLAAAGETVDGALILNGAVHGADNISESVGDMFDNGVNSQNLAQLGWGLFEALPATGKMQQGTNRAANAASRATEELMRSRIAGMGSTELPRSGFFLEVPQAVRESRSLLPQRNPAELEQGVVPQNVLLNSDQVVLPENAKDTPEVRNFYNGWDLHHQRLLNGGYDLLSQRGSLRNEPESMEVITNIDQLIEHDPELMGVKNYLDEYLSCLLSAKSRNPRIAEPAKKRLEELDDLIGTDNLSDEQFKLAQEYIIQRANQRENTAHGWFSPEINKVIVPTDNYAGLVRYPENFKNTLSHEADHYYQDGDKAFKAFLKENYGLESIPEGHDISEYTGIDVSRITSEKAKKDLAKLTEQLARGSQMKNYQGYTSSEQMISPSQLEEMSKTIVADTGADSYMSSLFSAITDYKKAAKWLSYATMLGGAAYLSQPEQDSKTK